MKKAIFRDITGFELEISDSDFRRLDKRTTPDGRFYKLTESGVILNLEQMSMIVPPVDDGTQKVEEKQAVVEEEAPQVEPDKEPSGMSEIDSYIIKAILKKHGMNHSGLAKETGYGTSVVRMAVKEGRADEGFIAVLNEKYPEFFEGQEPPEG